MTTSLLFKPRLVSVLAGASGRAIVHVDIIPSSDLTASSLPEPASQVLERVAVAVSSFVKECDPGT